MAENIHNFTQNQLREKTKRTVYEESIKQYLKITKSKAFQHRLDNNACKSLLNESATVQNLPVNSSNNSGSN